MLNLVTVPLSSKLLINHFEDNSISYNIDYSNSKIKNVAFINYLYNIQIETNVAVDINSSYEEKSELFLTWLEFRDVIYIDTFAHTLLNLLLIEKDANIRFPSIFTEKESKQFIVENIDLINRIIEFMDSLILFLLYKFDEQPIETFNVKTVDDSNYVPKNVATIFSIEEFYTYYSLPFREKKWFSKYFETKHNTIISHFLLAPNNIILGFINAIVKNKITPEAFIGFMNAQL